MTAPVADVLCAKWANKEDIPQEVLDSFPDTITDADIDDALWQASEILWMLSGRVWYGGGCEETAILRSLPPQPGTGTWPYDSSWGRCACWSHSGWTLTGGIPWPLAPFLGQHVEAPIAVQLPRSPVTEVTEVLVDGAPFADWNLLRSGWLERTDGQPWQLCDNSVQITYLYGEPPPRGGRAAAVELAIEFIRYKHGLDGCRLPRKATSITRQGLTINIDPLEFLDRGGTGLLGVDLWLRAVNPGGEPQGAMVISPDLPHTMRT